MLLFSSIKARISVLLLTIPLFSLLLYTKFTQPTVEYAFPQDVLRDYTSPSTHCFWPEQDKLRSGTERASVSIWKEWIGFGSSEEQYIKEDDLGELRKNFRWEGALPDVIPTSGIERYMLSHIEDLQNGFDPKHDYEEYGLKLGNISLEEYTRELLSTYKNYLLPSQSIEITPPTYLAPVLSRLSLRPPVSPLPPRPQQVITTDKSIDDLPWQFGRWKEIMPDWKIKYFDDNTLKAWVNQVFGKTKAESIWLNLPRQVLKTDIFRYMAMLVEGGIYTDSDTAPIIHADEWGIPYHHETSPLLTHLSRLLSLTTSQHLPSSHPLSSFSPEHSTNSIDGITDFPNGRSKIYDGPLVDDGNELGEPALVISVESDAIEFGWTNWREVGLSRAVQITQWTFMARPGHPIFLDALGRTLKKSEEMKLKLEEAKTEFIAETALEWTGPGVFSDCVYRYLLIRYGFQPSQLLHKKEPTRIGDVLILPAGSFSSVSPFEEEEQRPWAASFHGFLGRWRDLDPAVQEFEKLKKIKEEAEGGDNQDTVFVEEAEDQVKKQDDKRITEKRSTPRQVGDYDGRLGDVPLSPVEQTLVCIEPERNRRDHGYPS
ncbi:uncharacterized protein I206_104209 [Kwoniella pini CBS 10737]|uniref:Glycosyltransferase n=1 Tax=Kwoniella pini CBS 10737 TaxID=1296096 RepID=A0A1B9I2C4_9TREE|nr:glycosyltransferase [Kwoniella pini CBS 10737]OCF49692.1 glycosyltransferase [Kwoniella pini CBS 10737]